MRQSALFSKTRTEAPADEVSKNAILLTRAGFIHKELSGVYSFLPLGLRTLTKIMAVIRTALNSLGAAELLLTTLQNPEPWQETKRWDLPVWFKTSLTSGSPLGLAWTHEEAITVIARDHLKSYQDFPQALYQFQTKFRNEERAKSGLLRGREFLMNDMYSFSRTAEELDTFYQSVSKVYERIFHHLGIGADTYKTFASGGAFSTFSHEWQTITPAGEDTIYIDEQGKQAVNREVLTDQLLADLKLKREALKEARAIEVGNIFKLGTRFSSALQLNYRDQTGAAKPVYMGSYGLGVSRLMGAVVEARSTEQGMFWPVAIAPYAVHLLTLGGGQSTEILRTKSNDLYQSLTEAGVEVLWDDREMSAGEKFAEADLIGLPWRLIVSERSLATNGVELGDRLKKTVKILTPDEALAVIRDHV